MDIFAFLGGLALFLFGLYQIRTAMETFMKGRLRSVIGRMTAGTVRTIALGTGLTMLMQSSTAVTVVTVGMVESGALEKRKAFLLVMGANLGTTATAWLVALGASGGEKKSGNTVLLVLLCLGVLMEYFQRCSSEKWRNASFGNRGALSGSGRNGDCDGCVPRIIWNFAGAGEKFAGSAGSGCDAGLYGTELVGRNRDSSGPGGAWSDSCTGRNVYDIRGEYWNMRYHSGSWRGNRGGGAISNVVPSVF